MFSVDVIKKLVSGPRHKVLKKGQTKAWDHVQTIELGKLSTQLVSEAEGMESFDDFYIFYRTFKRWTTRKFPNRLQASSRQAPAGPRHVPCRAQTGPMQAPCRPQATLRSLLGLSWGAPGCQNSSKMLPKTLPKTIPKWHQYGEGCPERKVAYRARETTNSGNLS